jgi:hypothetical protein
MGLRVCKECKLEKDLEEFPKHKECLGGLAPVCKVCKRRYGREHYQKKKNLGISYVCKEKLCLGCNFLLPAQMFSKRLVTKDGLSTECKKCNNKKQSGRKLTLNARYRSLYHSAKRRNLDICTKDEFLLWYASTPNVCYYCEVDYKQFLVNMNSVLTENRLKRFREIFCNPTHRKIRDLTIDQNDPCKGYIIGNMVKCCWVCNYIKGGILTGLEFLSVASWIRLEIEGRLDQHKDQFAWFRKHDFR